MSHNVMLPPAIFIMGPTAAGKTDLAIALLERLPCAIISVDSAMVYRGMDIGTAKPDAETLARAPHRLIDILDPAEAYSAARFREDALREMAEITASGRVPLLVGGTMLYYRALQYGLSELPAADSGVRAQLEADAERLGWAVMHERLAAVDPESAQRIHPNDPQRLQRALEVYEVTGRPLSELWREQARQALPYQLVKLVIAPAERSLLHERIERRFNLMLELGFIKEVERLYHRGDLHTSMPSVRCVGYRQVWDYLEGRGDYDAMKERAIIATRQFAKRQFTWLRAEEDAEWLEATDGRLLEKTLKILDKAKIFNSSL